MRTKLQNVRIAGIAAAVPKGVETIIECEYGTREVREKFIANTGVQERRKCSPELWCSDLCQAAAERLIEQLGWDKSEIGAVVLVTQSPDMSMPATACILQDKLGLSNDCAAFDVNLGCSGHVYGLHIVGSLLSEHGITKALLLAGDAMVKSTLPSRRSTIPPIFGDAGTATALEWSGEAAPIHFDLKTFGSDWNVISALRNGGRPPLVRKNFAYEVTDDDIVLVSNRFKLKGEDVFNFAAREAPKALREILDFAGRDEEAVDAFVIHQANQMINEFIRKRMGVELARMPSSLAKFGNTSSATVPVTIVTELRERITAERMELVLCGFGVGTSIATAHCVTDGIVCPPLVEV